MTADGDDMITTTHDGETLLSLHLDWLKITEVAAAVALGIILAVLWLQLARGGHTHG